MEQHIDMSKRTLKNVAELESHISRTTAWQKALRHLSTLFQKTYVESGSSQIWRETVYDRVLLEMEEQAKHVSSMAGSSWAQKMLLTGAVDGQNFSELKDSMAQYLDIGIFLDQVYAQLKEARGKIEVAQQGGDLKTGRLGVVDIFYQAHDAFRTLQELSRSEINRRLARGKQVISNEESSIASVGGANYLSRKFSDLAAFAIDYSNDTDDKDKLPNTADLQHTVENTPGAMNLVLKTDYNVQSLCIKLQGDLNFLCMLDLTEPNLVEFANLREQNSAKEVIRAVQTLKVRANRHD